MLLECPTRHRSLRRTHRVGARHVRRPRARRLAVCAALKTTALPVDGLIGSYDPVWTAGAEGRFLAGAFTSPSRHPIVIVGRIILLVALVAPGVGPFLGAFHTAHGAFQAPLMFGLGAIALVGMRRLLIRR
jgi:hypothetical protein